MVVSFWRLSQLRKKLCHFMIMVLSCFDLVSAVINHSTTLFYLISWLRENYDLLVNSELYVDFITVWYTYSFVALLVMSFERYLGAYYPIFHRTSVTRRRLLTLLAMFLIFNTTLHVISTSDIIISRTPVVVIFAVVVFLPLVYLNFKPFKIFREVRRRKAALPKRRTTINLKSVVSSSSASAYFVFTFISENKQTSNVRLSLIWSTTIWNTDCTFNSLIFS